MRQKSVQRPPLSVLFLLLNAATFRGISGQKHGDNTKKAQWVHCIVLKEQFDVVFLAKMTKSLLGVVRFRSQVKEQVNILRVVTFLTRS